MWCWEVFCVILLSSLTLEVMEISRDYTLSFSPQEQFFSSSCLTLRLVQSHSLQATAKQKGTMPRFMIIPFSLSSPIRSQQFIDAIAVNWASCEELEQHWRCAADSCCFPPHFPLMHCMQNTSLLIAFEDRLACPQRLLWQLSPLYSHLNRENHGRQSFI